MQQKKIFFSSKKILFKSLYANIAQSKNRKIIIAGGSSIRGFYKYINQLKRGFCLSDERILNIDDYQSNYFQISQIVKNRKKIIWPNYKFFQIKTVQEKLNYTNKCLSNQLFDLSILTIGDDGHVASIFDNTLINNYLCSKKTLISKNNNENFERISLSLSMINKVKKNIIIIIGKKKIKLINTFKSYPFKLIKNSTFLMAN